MNVGNTVFGISEELFNYLINNYDFDDTFTGMFTRTAVVGEGSETVYIYMFNDQTYDSDMWNDFLDSLGIDDWMFDEDLFGIGEYTLIKSTQNPGGL